MSSRPVALDALVGRVRKCRICVDDPNGRPLPVEPRPVLAVSEDARILIAGQAPGTRVYESGIPFDDRSGDRLRNWLNVTPDEFYDVRHFAIMPMGFCFPGQDAKGGDLPPRSECAPAWRAALMELMPRVELVIAIGIYAQAWHLAGLRMRTLTETVSNWRSYLSGNSRPAILPIPHPSWHNTAWLKQNPWFENELLPELRRRTRSLIDRSNEQE